MRRSTSNESSAAHGIDGLDTSLVIKDGKLTVESKSSPKSGSVELAITDQTVELTITGAGSDQATARMSIPEFANFQTIVDAMLAQIDDNEKNSDSALERNALYAGHRPLRNFGDEIGVSFDESTLQKLGLVDESGEIPGGTRQVRCTVLGNGTAILTLVGDRDTFKFNR